MKRFFVDKELQVNKNISIEGIEHNHIKNVMRMKVGDEIILVCGDEYDYFATILSLSKGETVANIHKKQINEHNPTSDITVFQALVKSDNMTLIIQKLTELGIKNFVPFESEFITSKDKFGKTSKFQEISNQSIKQCKRSMPMIINPTRTFKELLSDLKDFDLIVFANECESKQSLNNLTFDKCKRVAIVVGSEGGFSQSEIDMLISAGAKSISLGKRILRAETASIALSAVVMCKMGEWDL